MRFSIILVLCLLGMGVSSCKKEDDTQPLVNPTIEFRTEDGYTYLNDTVPPSDTLTVGVLITRGTNAMHHFKVTVSYDGGDPFTTDSLPMGTDTFEFDKTIIAQPSSGTEKWSFNIVENDGDVIRRSLTFTVL